MTDDNDELDGVISTMWKHLTTVTLKKGPPINTTKSNFMMYANTPKGMRQARQNSTTKKSGCCS
eukprot:6173355-Pyramimonas_sp.AAC.1